MSILTAPRLYQAIRTAGVAIDSVTIGTFGVKASYLVQPSTLQAAAQPTIDTFDDSPAGDVASSLISARSMAIENYANGPDGFKIVLRALALVMLDEINLLRAAASLTPRTAAQIKTAITNKINAGTADTQ